MAADNSLWLSAAYAAAASTVATAGATELAIPIEEYTFATLFAAIGIAGRHFHEAAQAGRLEWKKLAFDVPTAPMLGIIIWTLLGYGDVAYAWRAGLVVGGAYLGPEWLRGILTGVSDLFVQRMKGKS